MIETREGWKNNNASDRERREREIESERGERSPRSRNVGRELKNKHIKEKKK